MMKLDQIVGYHRKAVHSATNHLDTAFADMIFLKVAYEEYGGKPAHLSPSIEELFARYAGNSVEEGFEKAEVLAYEGKGQAVIPCETELRILNLWTPDMQSRKERIAAIYKINEMKKTNGPLNEVPLEYNEEIDPVELNPKYVPLIQDLLLAKGCQQKTSEAV